MLQAYLSRLRHSLGRQTLCLLGLHTKPTGVGFDACSRGCGYARQPLAGQWYVVILNDGSRHHVRAINTYHAESLVAYAGDLKINPDGTPCGEVRVHRKNIVSVSLETSL